MAGALLLLNGSALPRSTARRPCPSLPHRPIAVTMSQNQSYWASINAEIDAHLKQAIPLRPPLEVFEPMHHLAFAAPQNNAPALCVAACELVGGRRDQATAAASALHLMYAASFAHEQLPLTDRPRPTSRPTTQHAYGPNIELLIPDGMTPFGFELLAKSDDPAQNNSGRIFARVTIEIARAMGSQGTVDGQYHELDRPQSDDIGWIEHMSKKKEGGFYACGAACGAILGGGSEEEIEKLRRFGLYVGMIQGMLHGVGRKEKGLAKVVEELRNLALKELEEFKGGKVEAIASFV